MIKLIKKFQKDNKGASLLTVIITVTFLAILGAMLIGVALVNYQMKRMDLRSKKDFYTVETAVDDIYNGIGKEMTQVIANAYETALQNNNSSGFTSEEAAYASLCQEMVLGFQEAYGPSYAIGGSEFNSSLMSILNTYLVPPADGSASVEYIKNVEIGAENKYIALRGMVVNYSNSTLDTTSSITTDMVILAPTIRMFDKHDYVWDYALIGNQGIYVKDANPLALTPTFVNGNIFGGSSESDAYKVTYGQKDVYGGINVLDTSLYVEGETIISGADFNIKGAQVTLLDVVATNVWAGNMNVTGNESNVFVNGNMYLNNDLEINGNNGTITLRGKYYGYSDNSVTKESEKLGKEHAKSSSILVNGRKNKLDLNGLEFLLISGRSYMDFAGHGSENSGEYGTGEALALRTNQFIYLVPTEYLQFANPEKYTYFNTIMNGNKVTQFLSDNALPEDWFGWKYLNQSQPVKQEIVEVSGDKFVYFFLNFKSPVDERKYVNEILTSDANNPQAYELKKRMQERSSTMLKELMIGVGSDKCNIYSNFQVMEYDSSHKLQASTNSRSSFINTYSYAKALNSRYSYLMDTLDPKMDIALDQEIGDSGLPDADLPLSSFMETNPSTNGLSKITKNYSSNGSAIFDCYKKTITRNGYGYDVILSNEDLSFDGNLTNFKGVIFTTGNLSIKNCNIEGLVISNKTLTVDSSKISASRELLMTLIEAESLEIDELGIEITDDAHASYFVHYLKDPRYNGSFPYGKDAIGNDFTQFIIYENWKKGDVR